MGNSKSNEDAKDFFTGFGNKLEQGFDGLVGSISAPGNLAKALGQYLNSPLGGITIPIIIIGGLFVVSTVLKK